MNETNKKIKITEIEELKYQADIIVGLSNVFALFLDFTEEDEHLKGGMECLVNEACRMRDNCNTICEKLFPRKNNKISE